MPLNAVLFGALLFLLGPLFYFLQDAASRSATAFIPSLFGILLAAFGLAARTPSRVKAAMHGAATVALLGILGSAMSAPKWPKILTGQAVTRPLAAWEQLITFVLCAIFLFLCVRSFRAARRAKS